jgi:hypothetical protein
MESLEFRDGLTRQGLSSELALRVGCALSRDGYPVPQIIIIIQQVLGRLRLDHHKVEVNLGYTLRPCLKTMEAKQKEEFALIPATLFFLLSRSSRVHRLLPLRPAFRKLPQSSWNDSTMTNVLLHLLPFVVH